MIALMNLPEREPEIAPLERRPPTRDVVVVRVDVDDAVALRAARVVRWCSVCFVRVAKRGGRCDRRCCR